MLWIRFMATAALLALAQTTTADWLLKPLSERARAGDTVDIDVYLVNDTDTPLADGLPRRLPAGLRGPGGVHAVTLDALEPSVDLAAPIAAGGFRKQRYRVRLPETLRGAVRIELERLPDAHAYVAVDGADVAAAPAAPDDATVRVDTVPEPVLSPHEPMYFLLGPSGTNTARFQFSFKYRLFDERGWPARLFAPLGKLHFGYTQTSLWDIGGTSSPFRDTSYKPSLFYYEPRVDASADGRYLMGLQAGIEHESNGRDGARSRSINIAYVKPSWRWFIDDEHYFSIAPKLYGYIERTDNPDIDRYRGRVDLELRYGKRDGWLFSGLLRKGDGSGYSAQLDASYPLRRPFFANAGGYVHFQYFNGYGETLLDYNVRRSPQLRIGFSIVR